MTLYGQGNLFIKLGDSIDRLLEGLIPLDVEPLDIGDGRLEATIQYSLLTIIQYIEELDNNQLVEALRNRVDLKYALHLPLMGPSFQADAFCDFRKQVFQRPAIQQILQDMLERLTQYGLFEQKNERGVSALQLLIAVCTLNRFNEVVETMNRVLEALAVTDPEWLRQVTLPYWYDRYNRRQRSRITPFSDQKWHNRALLIATDIQYLLGEIDKSRFYDLTALREVQDIRRVWDEQFIIFSSGTDNAPVFKWRLTQCASCSAASVAKEA